MNDFRSIVKAPFIYGEDKLPSEEMKQFLMGIQMVIAQNRPTEDEELQNLMERLEDFLQIGGPSGKNLDFKERRKRISGD